MEQTYILYFTVLIFFSLQMHQPVYFRYEFSHKGVVSFTYFIPKINLYSFQEGHSKGHVLD